MVDTHSLKLLRLYLLKLFSSDTTNYPKFIGPTLLAVTLYYIPKVYYTPNDLRAKVYNELPIELRRAETFMFMKNY